MRRHLRCGLSYRDVEELLVDIDVWLSVRRALNTARPFFTRALATGAAPVEVTTAWQTAPAEAMTAPQHLRRRNGLM